MDAWIEKCPSWIKAHRNMNKNKILDDTYDVKNENPFSPIL